MRALFTIAENVPCVDAGESQHRRAGGPCHLRQRRNVAGLTGRIDRRAPAITQPKAVGVARRGRTASVGSSTTAPRTSRRATQHAATASPSPNSRCSPRFRRRSRACSRRRRSRGPTSLPALTKALQARPTGSDEERAAAEAVRAQQEAVSRLVDAVATSASPPRSLRASRPRRPCSSA